MKKLAIVYYSGYGHTKVLAEEIKKGMDSITDVESTLFDTQSLKDSIDILDDYDAIIFGSPTYMGSVAAGLKEFMEKSSRKWYEQKWKNKIAAGFTNSHSLSGDKLNSLVQLVVFAAQHGMIWVGQAEHNQSPEGSAGKEDVVNRIGSYLGVMAQSENDTPDVTPPSGDKLTAFKFGQRIAEITKAFSF